MRKVMEAFINAFDLSVVGRISWICFKGRGDEERKPECENTLLKKTMEG